MRLILTSNADLASTNILGKLLAKRDWSKEGLFEGNPCYHAEDYFIVTINEYHLDFDDIDARVKEELSIEPEVVIVASKHKSESGLTTLTVHPIGNFHKAEFGGRERALVPAAPCLMTGALRLLHERAGGLPYKVSFEATHHGPYLETPTFYIEIGSSELQWKDERAAEAIADAILGAKECDHPVAIGVGGGHYCPRMTDVALARKVSFGHIIPSYALDDIAEEMLEKAIELTRGASLVYFHRKEMKKSEYSRLKEWFEGRGLRVIREDDLEPIDERGRGGLQA